MKSSCTGVSVNRAHGRSGARRSAGILILAFGYLVRSGAAEAQASGSPIAQALFEEARTLMNAGRYDEACEKLSESQRVDPASGTLLNLAVCHEKQGKTATAWAEYSDVVAATRREGNAERQRIASHRIAELEPKLCRLSIASSADVPKATLVVRIDGSQLSPAALETPLPLDPGTHLVEIESAGRTLWSGPVNFARDGVTNVVTLVGVQVAGGSGAPVDVPQTRWAYVLGATGVVALGLGSYFGLRAKAEWDERNAHCAGGTCDDRAVSASDNAHALAIASDVGFGIGVTSVALAAFFALTGYAAASRADASTRIWGSVDRTRVTIGGSF